MLLLLLLLLPLPVVFWFFFVAVVVVIFCCCCLFACLVGCFFPVLVFFFLFFFWLVGWGFFYWLVDWSVGLLVGWLVGFLVGGKGQLTKQRLQCSHFVPQKVYLRLGIVLHLLEVCVQFSLLGFQNHEGGLDLIHVNRDALSQRRLGGETL